MLSYAIAVFLGAFLLFQVQPMIARMILPWFGGSAALWITCMLFFQIGLLAGYLYAHGSIRYLKPKSQALVHCLLLAASLLALPLAPSLHWKPAGIEEPILRIVGLLTASVGLPYVLLASTGPLFQAWYARKDDSALPYRLFALSNLASLVGLLAYPFVIEPNLTLREQSVCWSLAYGAFVGLGGIVSVLCLTRRGSEARQPAESAELAQRELQVLSFGDRLWWLLLSCCGVVLLLSVTNHITQNVTSIPFLWILPLSLYLLSFMLCFNVEYLYRRRGYLWLLAAVLSGMVYGTVAFDSRTSLKLVIPLFSFGLFVCCMFCHGELAERKPAPRHLTSFYLMVALGGALGGVLIGVVAPSVFHGYFEMPLALSACALLVFLVQVKRGWTSRVVSLLLAIGAFTATGYYLSRYTERVLVMERNFYGWLRVKEYATGTELASRSLLHGSITHGAQFTHELRRRQATTYYGPRSGVALAIQGVKPRPHRLGIIGLGVGTIAAYSRPGDVYRFYEIDPLVARLAREEFTYLADARGKIEIVLGDARLSLEREPDQHYDILAVDAFSGDAIPVHLLTLEALELYFRHLNPGGILAIHLTNTHLDLVPVVERLCSALGKYALLVENEEDEEEEIYAADWALITWEPLEAPEIQGVAKPLRSRTELRVWTDDYSNLFQIFKNGGESPP